MITHSNVFTRALTRVNVPRVTCTVETLDLLLGQMRQALARARVRQEVLPDVAGTVTEATLTFTRAPVVLQLYTGAVGRRVHVDCDFMRLQFSLLRNTRGSNTVETQT